jgi:hypothetical protein
MAQTSMTVNVLTWRVGRWMAMTDDLVRVLSTASLPEGEIAKARLEDDGIPVLLKGEGGPPYRMGPVNLFVPAAFEVQARLILSQTFEDSDLGQADDPSGLEADPGEPSPG